MNASGFPRALLQQILERVSDGTSSILPALVCTRWLEAYISCRLKVDISDNPSLDPTSLAQQLSIFRSLRSLSLSTSFTPFLLAAVAGGTIQAWSQLTCLHVADREEAFGDQWFYEANILSVARLLPSLKVLKYSNPHGGAAPWIVTMSSLTSLRLSLPSATTLPDDLGDQLQALVTLHIVDCKEVENLPSSIGDLSSLQELRLQDLPSLSSLPSSVHKLTSLRHLTIRNCHDLEALPPGLANLSRLEVLELFSLLNLRELPPNLGQVQAGSLRVLRLEWMELQSFPETLGLLRNLQVLTIQQHPDPSTPIERLPFSFGSLLHLRKLWISIPSLCELPPSIGQLQRLSSLEIETGKSQAPPGLEELPDDIVYLRSLRSLRLHCPRLRALPQSFGHLPMLTQLVLGDYITCNLQELPTGLSTLTSLERLCISARKLRSLPPNLGASLARLRHLSINEWTGDAEVLEEFLGGLSALRTLYLRSEALSGYPRFLWGMIQLATLQLEDCTRFDEMKEHDAYWEMQERILNEDMGGMPRETQQMEMQLPWMCLNKLHSLETLRICGHRLATLPASLSSLSSLTALDIFQARTLRSLPACLAKLTRLQHLRLHHAKIMHKLFEEEGACLEGSSREQASGKMQQALLKSLTLDDCRKLEDADSVWGWGHLERVVVRDCPWVQSFDCGEDPAWLGTVRELHMDCRIVNKGWLGRLQRMQSLEVLVVNGCSHRVRTIRCRRRLRREHTSSPESSADSVSTSDDLSDDETDEATAGHCLELPGEELSWLPSLREIRCSSECVCGISEGCSSRPLKSLEVLKFNSPAKVQALPTRIAMLSRLSKESRKEVHFILERLRWMPALQASWLPRSLANYEELETLIVKCLQADSLPSDLGCLRKLRSLDVLHCMELVDLPDTLSRLSSLTSLSIVDCPRLVKVPLGSLIVQKLLIENCPCVRLVVAHPS